jgi:hypothetical protein
VRCASAGAERRGGVLCADPAYVVIPQAKKRLSEEVKGRVDRIIPSGVGVGVGRGEREREEGEGKGARACVRACTRRLTCPLLPNVNVPGKQFNAVWGRYPTACAIYVLFFKKLGVYWGLFDEISPAIVRVEELGCAGSASSLAYFGCNFAWSLLPKGVIAEIDNRRCVEALQTASPGSPLPLIATCTYLLSRVLGALGIFIHPLHCATALYLPKRSPVTFAVSNQEFWPCQKALPRGKNFSFTET